MLNLMQGILIEAIGGVVSRVLCCSVKPSDRGKVWREVTEGRQSKQPLWYSVRLKDPQHSRGGAAGAEQPASCMGWEEEEEEEKLESARLNFSFEGTLDVLGEKWLCGPLLRHGVHLALEDPVHSVSLQQFVYEKLKAQQAVMGDQGFGVLMETVDTELVRQLQEFLKGL
ncbi:Importin-11 [Liparis tanakae]|uniref:Importin-11 n=1 Tax=Liparis tanakae TaxID=230148 RepID=A0A4Z2HGX5_9TELE|nr:Importin-11 [Liparis tanakae]